MKLRNAREWRSSQFLASDEAHIAAAHPPRWWIHGAHGCATDVATFCPVSDALELAVAFLSTRTSRRPFKPPCTSNHVPQRWTRSCYTENDGGVIWL